MADEDIDSLLEAGIKAAQMSKTEENVPAANENVTLPTTRQQSTQWPRPPPSLQIALFSPSLLETLAITLVDSSPRFPPLT
ncbi:hypothetical protein Gpo141_00010895 [Globisporangium polare]